MDHWWRLRWEDGHDIVAIIMPHGAGWEVRIRNFKPGVMFDRIDYPPMPIEELRSAVEVMVRMS
jgi:hypothetical protein